MASEALSPACLKCPQVTGKSTCFPGPCVFFHERNLTGTKSNQIETLDWVRNTGARRSLMASELPHESPPLPYERLSEAMYTLSAQLAMTGWLDDDTNHAIYERVVKAWQAMDKADHEVKVTMLDYALADRMITAFEQFISGDRVQRVRLAADILARERPGPYQPFWDNPDGPGAA